LGLRVAAPAGQSRRREETDMASTYSFDIVSQYDGQELKNAVEQTRREIETRYDLKGTKTELELNEKDIAINTESEMSLTAIRDILESKLVRRNLSLKILDYQDEEQASGGRVRQTIKLKQGIPDDVAKTLTKQIRERTKKVTPQIQGDAVRVQAKSKDDLQEIIQMLKGEDLPVALQFINFR
jgi:cyclic-di-GMP-binding protein